METPTVFEAIQQNPDTTQSEIQNVQDVIHNYLTQEKSEKWD